MKTVARIVEGKITQTRSLPNAQAVNLVRKGWVEVTETARPEADSFSAVVTGGDVALVNGAPVRQFTVTERPAAERRALIDAAAGAHIESVFPPYKQRNAIARHQELLEIKIDGGIWTEAEAKEAAALKKCWVWVTNCRKVAKRSRESAESPVYPAAPDVVAAL